MIHRLTVTNRYRARDYIDTDGNTVTGMIRARAAHKSKKKKNKHLVLEAAFLFRYRLLAGDHALGLDLHDAGLIYRHLLQTVTCQSVANTPLVKTVATISCYGSCQSGDTLS